MAEVVQVKFFSTNADLVISLATVDMAGDEMRNEMPVNGLVFPLHP
jgi:hypothetical protein